VVKKERYENGVLIDPDVKDTLKKKDTLSYPDEREATFKKNVKDWTTYIQKNLDQDAGGKSVKGGRVMVRFMVNTKGETSNIYLEKSVEFVLDEASVKVIGDSPLWTPAFQNGKVVNAYRRQPLTFIKE
jgi:periplasmic protein TonB